MRNFFGVMQTTLPTLSLYHSFNGAAGHRLPNFRQLRRWKNVSSPSKFQWTCSTFERCNDFGTSNFEIHPPVFVAEYVLYSSCNKCSIRIIYTVITCNNSIQTSNCHSCQETLPKQCILNSLAPATCRSPMPGDLPNCFD